MMSNYEKIIKFIAVLTTDDINDDNHNDELNHLLPTPVVVTTLVSGRSINTNKTIASEKIK